jgi:glycosyltransferase involved in cell wall biosynthesis
MSKDVLIDAPMRVTRQQLAGSEGDTGTRKAAMGATSAAPLKVCIIGLKCYDHIAGNPALRYLGGIETQLALLAKGLQREGCEVSLITYDHGQAERQVFEGVTVLKSYRPQGGIRWLRWFSRLAKLWRAMKIADADVYLQMGAGDETGMTALGCKMKFSPARPFVFCLAHDADCSGVFGAGQWEGQTLIYRYGIRQAALVISQTQTQQKNLKAAMGYSSLIIQMAATATEGSCGGLACANHVLWVGRIVPEKRPHWVLDLARRCPDITFHMAGSANNASEYAAKVVADAKNIPNVRMHGSLGRPELNKLFQSCSLLCCTSESEGFPTTFLEVWSCGMPIVTTFDPDGVIARHGLGQVATSIDELVSQIQSLPKSEAYPRMSGAARKYYLDNQTVEAVARRFHRAIGEMMAARKSV